MFAPRPIPGMVTEQVLVMELLPGVAYTRLDPTSELDGDRLLRTGIKGVLEATLTHGVFHGDLHAGNVLIDAAPATSRSSTSASPDVSTPPSAPASCSTWRRGPPATRAARSRRCSRSARSTTSATVERLVDELQAELDLLRDRARGEVTFDQLGITLGRLLQVLARNGFRMPKELVLFFKNLLYLAGFAASVAPEADVLAVVQDILLELLADPESGLAGAVA